MNIKKLKEKLDQFDENYDLAATHNHILILTPIDYKEDIIDIDKIEEYANFKIIGSIRLDE